MNKAKQPSFFRKLRYKYRISILNENTLEEAWHAKLSRFSVFIWACSLLAVTFVLMALIIMLTPVRHYLPGYGDASARAYLLNDAARVDSLMQQMAQQQEYIQALQGVIEGKLVPDSTGTIDTLALQSRAQQLEEKSRLEQEFCAEFEEKEKYSLSLIDEKQDVDMLVFFKPVKGIISSSFDTHGQQYGISIATAPNETVVSVLAGTVVCAEFTFENQWVIAVQHDNEYLSIYKNNSRLLQKVGARVQAGETIAIAGNTDENEAGLQLYLEIWKQGTPVNPENLIAF